MSDVKIPANLTPYVLKCNDCGTLVKYNEPTQSYFLIKISKGGIHNCKFCYSLSQTSIPESVGLKVK